MLWPCGVRIVVTEHGVGNVRSVVRAISRVLPSAEVVVSGDPDAVRRADRIVVPGQGSFGAFAKAMHGGLGDALVESIARGTPYLGICLGLQVLFEDSDEAPGEKGLGVYRGRVKRIAAGDLALPHIGWNSVLPGDRFFYFAHSYVAVPNDPSIICGTTEYGERFASMVRKDNVLGVQFHPEKSQREGLALLERFFTTQ
jgi:imidazole glycerol-phosphate synthase subunit HisH